MAHYDCSNCGVYGGIGWGICKHCTPKEYLDLYQEVKDLSERCDILWKVHIKEEQGRWKDQWLKENGRDEKKERMAQIEVESRIKE